MVTADMKERGVFIPALSGWRWYTGRAQLKGEAPKAGRRWQKASR